MKRLLYFGCMRDKGHNLFDESGCSIRSRLVGIPNVNEQIFEIIDASFTSRDLTQGKYNDCVIPPLRIVAWWDYSIDSRPGSNSNLIGYGYESAEEMIDDSYKIFPSVMNRQKRPVKG